MNIKNRKISPSLVCFFKEYKIPDDLYVPFLCDGFYETEVLKDKTFYCDFYSDKFSNLWDELVFNKNMLIKFFQINKPFETELMSNYFLSNNQTSFTSVCLLNHLFAGGRKYLLMTPKRCHSELILPELYKPINNIKAKEIKNLVAFQDLTYLSENQIKDCYKHESFIFICDCEEKINKTYSAFQIDDGLFVTWKL